MNYYKKIIATIAIILIPGLLMNLFAQKSVELKYDVNQGDKYEYKLHIDQDIVFDAGGQTMALDQLMDFRMTSNIDERSGEEFISKFIEQVKKVTNVKSIKFTENDGQEVKVDKLILKLEIRN